MSSCEALVVEELLFRRIIVEAHDWRDSMNAQSEERTARDNTIRPSIDDSDWLRLNLIGSLLRTIESETADCTSLLHDGCLDSASECEITVLRTVRTRENCCACTESVSTIQVQWQYRRHHMPYARHLICETAHTVTGSKSAHPIKRRHRNDQDRIQLHG